MRKIYSLISVCVCATCLVLNNNKSSAQIPTNQDCLGAIPVCTDVYYQPLSYQGDGNYHDEIGPQEYCPGNCMDHELNSVWYVISVQQSGLLRFTITPVSSVDDYDWAVYNMNDHECSEIRHGALLMMSSCNAAGGTGYQGTTGICSSCGGDANCENGGNTNKWCADLPVLTGDTYVLCVSNWTSTQSGYTLDFGSSTAQIFDTIQPFITVIDTVKGCSGSATVDFDFNENILCESIQASDFTIMGPDGLHLVDVVSGAGCEAGGTQEKFFTLSGFTPPITITGNYTINMTGNVTDLCENEGMAPVAQFYANMDPLPQVTDGPYDMQVPIGGTGTFHVETIGANTYAWQQRSETGFWTNLTETPPYSGTATSTLSVGPATMDLGGKEFRCKVSGVCTPASQSDPATLFVGDALAATASAFPEEICVGLSSQLDVNAMGGNTQVPYTYLWSAPDGWTSTQESPTVTPTQTTIYTVTVDDGFNPVTVNITVYVNPLPQAFAGPDQNIFHGTFTTLVGGTYSGTPPYTWNWQPSDSLWVNTDQNPVTRQLRGSTLFSLVVTDGNGCVSEPDNVTIGIIGGPLSASPTAYPAVICWGDTSQLFALPSGGDTLSYTYSWLSNGEEFSTLAQPFVTPTQNTTYTLLLDDGSNQITRNVAVTVNPLPVINFIKPEYHIENNAIQVCVFDSIVLDPGYLNADYLWGDGATTFNYTASTSGISFDYQIHKVRVTDINTGCTSIDSIPVAFTFTACTYGIDEIPYNDLIRLYPNPAGNSVTLSIDGGKGNYIVELTDLSGRLMFREEVKKSNTGILNHSIDLSDYTNATCLIRISSEKGSIVRKLVISH
ncbi:MAG TPA: T9SS type A sorting domain-containing protein [Lentimicrobium sp.]|nr:T9SS type A sorting domain-containing protein [Lentimicrobium sp.]